MFFIAILVLIPCIMGYAEETSRISPDESPSIVTDTESGISQPEDDFSSITPEESDGEETSEPEGSEFSNPEEEPSEPEEESSEVALEEEENGDPIALIKPLSSSGISLFAVPYQVMDFHQLWEYVHNTEIDIEVTIKANVIFNGTLTVRSGKKVVMKSDSATAWVLSLDNTMGGRRHVEVNGTLILESNLILDGKDSSGNPLGGGIEVKAGGNLSMQGAVIRNCKAEVGAGIRVYAGATASMSAGSIQNNVAMWGAGVFIENGSFQMSGKAVIEGGTATGTETPQGGGVLVKAGTFEMTGESQIRNCTAIQGSNGQGGGIYSDSGNVTLYSGSTISDSHASNNGGGILAYNTNLNITGGTVTGCTSENGGGLNILGRAAVISALRITSCKAYFEGGGMVVNGVQVTLGAGVNINQCSAGTPYIKNWWSSKGGGIFLTDNSGSQLIMQSGSSITNCTAYATENENIDYSNLYGSGGGIYVDSNAKAQLTGVSITGCHADHHGGGIFVKRYENLTTQDVSYLGNTALFYRTPADSVVAGTYPTCSGALSISVDSEDLEDRWYPLNNYDINHFSYAISYHGNGGIDTALPSSSQDLYRTVEEFTGFRDSETASPVYHTVYANSRSDNGDRFEFQKDGTELGAISNLIHYLPKDSSYYTYGPTPAYDRFSYSPARPTIATDSISAWDLMAPPEGENSRYPELKYYMLYTKTLTIEKEVIGDYGDQTKLFDIELKVFDYKGDQLDAYSNQYSFKHDDSDTFRIYDDMSMTVEEDTASAVGYDITYFDGTTTTDIFSNVLLDSYDQTDVVITVENTRFEPVPSGIFGGQVGDALFLTGLFGLVILMSSMMYDSRKRS